MLESLQAADVPVLVFSAGLGDSVSAVLRYHNALLPNVHIISNYLQFDGLRVNGFQGDIIHSFNKNEHAVEKSDYFEVSATNFWLDLNYLITYLLTPWSRVLLEKITRFQVVEKFPAFCGTQRFIIAFTSAHHLSLSCAVPAQSSPYLHISLPEDPS